MSDDQLQAFPPVTISDLIVLTLSIALAMGCAAPGIQDTLHAYESISGQGKWRDVSRELTDYTAIGLSLFGLMVLARQKIRGSAWRFEPGHWLLIAAGPYSVLLLFVIAFQPVGPPGFIMVWPDALLGVVVIASTLFLCLSLQRATWTWEPCLIAVIAWLLSVLGFCVWDAGRTLGFWKSPTSFRAILLIGTSALIVAAVAAFAAVIADIHRRLRRDWLHFCGLATLACHIASFLTTYGDMTIRWWRDLFLHLAP
jgi:hypothetical protein